MKRTLLFYLLLALGIAESQAAEPVRSPVYMFGFAASFTDTVAFITDIQLLDSAYFEKKSGFLVDRTQYSQQVADALEKMGHTNMTCSVFYSRKKKDIEKQYVKLRRRYLSSNNITMLPMGNDVFQFQYVEYIEPIAMEQPEKPDKKDKPKGGPGAGGPPPGGGAPGGMGGM